ncbi:MAG: hypothetical protein ABJE66_04970 [Deltaproteobacteria bacterium]
MTNDDLLDASIRAARPALATSLAPRVIARAHRPHPARMIAAGLASVVFATVVIALAANRTSHRSEPTPAILEPALAPAPSPPVPAPAPIPRVSPWADVPGLLAGFARERGTEIAACAKLERGAGDPEGKSSPWFRVSRGSVAVEYLVPHSLGYLGFTDRDRCYQRIAAKLAIPPLPEQLLDMRFTFGPRVAAMPAAYEAWRDPVAAARDLFAQSSKVRACVQAEIRNTRGSPPVLVVSFEAAGGGKARARVGDRMSRCLSAARAELVVPALPDELSSLTIEVSP